MERRVGVAGVRFEPLRCEPYACTRPSLPLRGLEIHCREFDPSSKHAFSSNTKNVLHTKNEGVESCRKLRQCYMSTLTTLFYASRLSPPPPTRNPALKPRTAAGKSLQSKCCRTRQRLRQHPSVRSTAPPLPRRGAEGCRIFRGGAAFSRHLLVRRSRRFPVVERVCAVVRAGDADRCSEPRSYQR